MSFGSGPFGSTPLGGTPTSFNLVSAVALNSATVQVVFSDDLDPLNPATYNPANYSIPGLQVLRVAAQVSPRIVRLYTTEQAYITYSLTVLNVHNQSGGGLDPFVNTQSFTGWPVLPQFTARAVSTKALQILFAQAMPPTPELTSVASYQVTDLQGASVTILSAKANTLTSVLRVRLDLTGTLIPGETYVVHVADTVLTVDGKKLNPSSTTFTWEQPTLRVTVPLASFTGEVKKAVPKDRLAQETLHLREFLALTQSPASGSPKAHKFLSVETHRIQESLTLLPAVAHEVSRSTSDLFGSPDGLVFFSPSLIEGGVANSTLQVDSVAVCSTAYDTYHFPQPPDPPPLYTHGGGLVPTLAGSVLNSGCVLFASFDRLTQAKHELHNRPSDWVTAPVDIGVTLQLTQMYDPARFGLLNNKGWTLGDIAAPSTYMFVVADNMNPIVPIPGPVLKYLTPAEVLSINALIGVVAAHHVAVQDTLGLTDFAHLSPGNYQYVVPVSETLTQSATLTSPL